MKLIAGCPKKDLDSIWLQLSKHIEMEGFIGLPQVNARWDYDRYKEATLIEGPPLGAVCSGVGEISFSIKAPYMTIQLPFNILRWMTPESNVEILKFYAAWAYVLYNRIFSVSTILKDWNSVYHAMAPTCVTTPFGTSPILWKTNTPTEYGYTAEEIDGME